MTDAAALRILIVTPTVPYPPNWGFGIRVFNFVRELSLSHEISVVCYADDDEQDKVTTLGQYCTSVHTVRSPLRNLRHKRSAQLRSVLSRRSFQTLAIQTQAMGQLIETLLSEGRFDLVQLESSQLSSLVTASATPWIIDEHNLEYELLQRMYEVERSPLRKFYNWLEYRKFRQEEVMAWRRSDACVLTSDRERGILALQEPGKLTHVAPNGVDIDYFSPKDIEVDSDSIVFTGLMSYRPNIDAVVFFVREVLPLIVEAHPTARFTVVGMGAPESVTSLAGQHVSIVGGVPDVRPYVWSASVFAVPLRMGSGTRLKVLEGLAMGKAMVSTSVGCEGISVEDGKHLVIADDPVSLAHAVLQLLHDADLNRRLGQAGRQLVEERYSWVSIVRDLERFHADVIESKRPR